MNSLNQQQYLADFAPKQSLDKYAKGADPRVISGIVALSEMQQQAAMRQRADLANGAAQGQMPTVRDKIIQMFQQANQPRQQPQQQPNPMAQGIMAQAHPQMQTAPMPEMSGQEIPQEAQMYHGGVARLPVSDRMFGYAGGGIIAFSGKERSDVPRIGEEVPLSPEERARLERELEMRLIGERARAEATGETAPASQSVEQTPDPNKIQAREDFRAGIANLIAGTGPQGVKTAIPVAASPVSNVPRREAPPPRLPDGRPNPAYAAFIENEAKRDRGADPFGYDQSKFPMPAGGIPTTIKDQKPTVYSGPSSEIKPTNLSDGQKRVNGMTLAQFLEHYQKHYGPPTPEQREVLIRRFNGAEADPVTTPPKRTGITQNLPATPATNAAKPSVTTPTTTTPAQDQESKLMDLMMKQFGPQPAVESTEARLKKRDEYVKNAPTSEEALAMIKHLDRMAKRYEANDQAEEAQRARNASNNLTTFLMNTRGSSLAVAAGKANAALQPLLADQETRRQNYQKLRDEQEMLLGKARYELAQAERARKEGRYADAEKSEMEAKKLQEQARGHNIQGLGSLINAAGLREERRLSREQTSEDRRLAREQSERHFQVQMAAHAENRAARIQQAQEQLESQDFQRRMAIYNSQTKRLEEERQKLANRLTLITDEKIRTQTQTRLNEIDRELDSKLNWALTGKAGSTPPSPGGNSALTSKADAIVGVK